MAAYNNALKLKPDYPEPMVGIARIYRERDQYDDAIMTIKRAIKQNPKKPEAHSLLGDIYLKQEEVSRQRFLKEHECKAVDPAEVT